MDFPKISGNSNGVFDLIDINQTYNGLTIDNANQSGVFSAVFTDSADLHTEAYLFFVVKNVTPESDANTNLTLGQIRILEVDESGNTIGTAWSTDGANVNHNTNGPIECDYVLTGSSTPFVGIEDGSGNIDTGDVATHVFTDASDTSLDSITSSNHFVKFKVENGTNGVGEVKIDSAGSTTHIHQMPLYTATELCSAQNGGIPNNSYAAFAVRVAIDDVAAFDSLNFKLVISHDGITGSGENADSSDISIPITISAQNLMQCQVFVGSTLKATGNISASGGTFISRMNKIPPVVGASDGITAAVYGFAEGAASASVTTNFATLSIAEQYANGGSIVDNLHANRTAFEGSENAITWKDTSAIGQDKRLSVTHIEDSGSSVISNIKNSFDIDRALLTSSENQYNVSFEQTSTGTGISTIEENKSTLGGYLNFDLASATKNIGVTFFATTQGKVAEEINTILNTGVVLYPVMSMSSNTEAKLSNSDFSQGNKFGANTAFAGVSSIDTTPIHHDHADEGLNSTIHAVTATSGTNSHFVPGVIENYQTSTAIDLMKDVNPAVTSVEVRLNSLQTADNPTFNGITSFGNVDVMKGSGFAELGCIVEQATVGAISDLPAFGQGNADNADGDNNQISAVISDTGFRDYAVRLQTTNTVFRSYEPSGFYDYNRQVQGFGAERYQIGISMPTGLIDYGFGKTPNHAQFAEKAKIAFAQYPCLPDLQTYAYHGKPIDSASIFSSGSAPKDLTIDTKWSRLTVLPNTATGAASSSRGGASDGLYDWAKDTSSDNTNKGSFKMVSTYNAEISDGSNLVDLEIHEQLVVNGAVSLNATTITVGTAGVLQEGMRLIEQKGGSNSSQNASNTAIFAATPFIVSDITGTTVTIVKDLGYSSDGTSNVVTTNVLPAIDDGADLVFIDDWTQVGMLVEHDNLVETDKEYSIAEITYVGGTQAGNQFSLATFPAALQAGATKVKLRLLHKRLTSGAVTNGIATGASTNKKLTFLKPHENFTEVDAGVNLKYEIKSQPLNRAKLGEKVRVVSGASSFQAYTELTSAANVGDETIINVDPSGLSSGIATCDIIVEKRGSKNVFEPGVTRLDGTKLLSKKNIGNKTLDIDSVYYANLDPSQGLGIYQFPAIEVAGSVYFKEFTFVLVNHGEEDMYWASAEFVDATWVRYKDSDGLVYAAQPPAATGVSWQVCKLGGSYTSQVTSSIFTTQTNLDSAPSVLTSAIDGRMNREVQNPNIENVVGCRFEVSIGAGISGSYYKYLKIEYVRDTGRTKHYYNGSNVVERPFKDKELYQALIPVLVTVDAAGQIEMQDVDGTNIESGTTISIDGLIA